MPSQLQQSSGRDQLDRMEPAVRFPANSARACRSAGWQEEDGPARAGQSEKSSSAHFKKKVVGEDEAMTRGRRRKEKEAESEA